MPVRPQQLPSPPPPGLQPESLLVGRRNFLRGGLAAGVLLAGGSLVYRGFFRHPPPAPGMLTLAAAERDTLSAMAEVYFPGGDDMPSWKDVDVVGFTDRYIAEMAPRLRDLTKLLIRTIDLMAVPGTRELSRFSKLSFAAREEVLDAWEVSKISPRRLGFLSLKLALAMGYFEHDTVRQAMGWYMPCQQIHEDDGMEEWL